MTDATDVLTFWFEECKPQQWFESNSEFDQLILRKFGELLIAAAHCELYQWRDTDEGRLAEIIVLDQFSRNVYRGTPQAFAQDPLALSLAQQLVTRGLAGLTETQRGFALMPYMHSESRVIHEAAEPLFKAWTSATTHDFELQHKTIIDRFGRYPHRNATLSRGSTDEEREFLKQPNSGF